MGKTAVEKAPEFKLSEVNFEEIKPYFDTYGVTDEKGRYLHWDQLKWRVPAKEAKQIWTAIKFKRSLQMKFIQLVDDKEKLFSYSIPNSIEAKIHQVIKIAGGTVGTVAGNIASDSVQKKFLVSSLMMEEAITSAQLEGASTTREVAKKMLQDERDPVDENERMILNNYLLLKYAEKNKSEKLTIDLILKFHEIATKDTIENKVIPGEFRQDDDIYVEDSRGEIAHKPPCYKEIPVRLQMLCDFANYDHSGTEGREFIAPVVKAIILHFMIGYEHPFRDGNGRTARAIFYWYMLKNEYELFKYISISRLLKESPKEYGLSYMYTERDQNDLTYFIDFQLDVILKAFEELKSYLKSKTQEFIEVIELLENSELSRKLNFIQKDIIKKGTKEPGRMFTVKEISNSYDISENTARTHLNKLCTERLLLKTKDSRTTLYISPSDLRNRLKSPLKA